jgi:hypothetical protein
MAEPRPEERTSPDRKERSIQAKTRFVVFAFVIIVSSLVLAAILLIGPFAEPAEGQRPTIVIIVPLLTGLALLAALVWFFVQSRRGGR